MTSGHRHRTVRVKRGGVIHVLLTVPTIALADRDRAERSRLAWGPTSTGIAPYRLSPLGVLHGLFGLTLDLQP